MKIESLRLFNFKGIEELDIEFGRKSTILFGINGVGKSSILRAIDLLYANIINRVSTYRTSAQIELEDIMYGKARTEIGAEFSFSDNTNISYGRFMSRFGKKRTHKLDQLKEIQNYFIQHYIEEPYEDEEGNYIIPDDLKNMPVFVNYGVNRLVLKIPVRVSNRYSFDKMSAFDKAIESRIDFRLLFEWFRAQEDYENQIKVREGKDYEDKSLKAVKRAMLAMMPDCSDIYIERKPLAMKVVKAGESLSMSQLSDGEKCTIALFGDLARRLALANPSLENPLQGTGVVLIDEVELHMHTSWQRRVVPVLQNLFPNIQFIITTHSPQVLGELTEDSNLYTLLRIGEKIECRKCIVPYGWDSNVILEELMKTSSLNQDIKKMIEEMYESEAAGNYGRAYEIADEIDSLTNGKISDTAKIRMIINRKTRNAKN